MTKRESYVFDVDIGALQQSSKRPFHLEQRMNYRKMQARLTAKAAELNRNAFLEARRSKLANRYLYSRQVQSQHHQKAKNQEKDKRKHLSRLLESAEAKRHMLLANQVKNCSMAVARAKEVVRLHTIRTEKEREHRRIELDLRISHSSKRRNRILKNISGKFSSSDSNSLTKLDAVFIIQGWWRRLKFAPLINSFKRFDLTVETSKVLEFPVIAIRLKSKPLLKAAAALLSKARCISSLYSKQNKYRNSIKVFMTAYLINAYPAEILGETEANGLPHQVYESAKEMLIAFETWISSLGRPNFYSNLHSFLGLWDGYFFNFEAWKSADSRDLIDNLTQHFIELDVVWNKVKGDKESEREWSEAILRQREEIKDQLRNIAGEDAVQELLAKQRLSRQAYLQPLESPSLVDSSPKIRVIAEPSDSVAFEQSSNSQNSSQNIEKIIEEVIKPHQGSNSDAPNSSSELTVRQLAHELIMNPQFKLEPDRFKAFKKVRDIGLDAFFDILREKIMVDVGSPMFLDLLSKVEERILQLLPARSHYRITFISRFDLDIVRQQISQNTFQPFEWIGFIKTTLQELCAPVRDEIVMEIANYSDPVDAFQHIFKVLDIMTIDHLNHQLTIIRPSLINQAVSFEAKKFDQLLEKGELSLTLTTSWLESSVQNAKATILSRHPTNISLRSSWPNFESLFTDAFLTLLFSNTPTTMANCPETLILDLHRLYYFQNELQRVALVAALVMIAQNFSGKQSVLDSLTKIDLKDTLFILLKDDTTTLDNISAYLSNFLTSKISNSNTQELLASQFEFLDNMVRKTISYRDPFYIVLARRLQRVIRQIILADDGHELPGPDTLGSFGLGVVHKEIAAVGSAIRSLARFNRQVYAMHYDGILSRALSQAMKL